MDVMMPVLDGLEATQRIRSEEAVRGGHIPILALTASIIREDHEKCIAAGMDRVEAKPINFDQLFLSMEQIVPPEFGQANTGARNPVQLSLGSDGTTAIDFSPTEPVADYAKALRTWQDPLAYAKALLSFVEHHAQDAALMERALAADPVDVEAVRSIAHALKGLAGNLRLTRVTRLAVEIDADLKAGQVEQAKTRLADLAHSLGRAEEAIGKLLLPIDCLSTPATAWDSAEIVPLLAELSSALEQLNPDTVEPLLARLATLLSRSDLAPIASAVDVFDFDLAQVHTTALTSKLSATSGE
jgi:CheY-like chemotaxis protein